MIIADKHVELINTELAKFRSKEYGTSDEGEHCRDAWNACDGFEKGIKLGFELGYKEVSFDLTAANLEIHELKNKAENLRIEISARETYWKKTQLENANLAKTVALYTSRFGTHYPPDPSP